MELSIEEEKPFIFKSYTKKELACMYSPSITPRCAIRIFTKWIKMNQRVIPFIDRNRLPSANTHVHSPTSQNYHQYSGHSLGMTGIFYMKEQSI